MTSPQSVPTDAIPDEIRRAAHGVVGPLDVYVHRSIADIMVKRVAAAILAERERCATFVETMAVSRGYAGGQPRGADFVRRTNPSSSAQALAAAIRAGA